MDFSRMSTIHPRDDSLDEVLDLLKNPFKSQVSGHAFLAALGTSIGGLILIGAAFCYLRPHNSVVYAPRSKHADEKHAPPPVGKGYFDWIAPVIRTKEQMLVDKIGMDATLFLKFIKMCRNIFLSIAVVGCGIIIPVNLIYGSKNSSSKGQSIFMKLGPSWVNGTAYWAYVICAYVFDIIICFFLWRNYRDVLRLRRMYFDSPEYQRSLHSRTLLITQIPKGLRTDEGLVKIAEESKDVGHTPRTSIARNVKDLPDLIEEHDEAVRELEQVLAKYMKNPDRLPALRPTCKVSTADKSYRKGQKVDAIEYLTARIRELELEIKEVRESVDKRNAMSFGFASYQSIADAHTVAYATRNKGSHHTDIRLAPKPNDLIWNNLPRTRADKRWATFMNNVWVAVLTVGWLAPNALIAVFVSNLSNLADVWPAFRTNFNAHATWWAVVQGVAAPALTSLFYYFLPIIFRRLSMNSGDYSKTSRDRHVTHKLYTFFVINNLFLFSLFGALCTFVITVVNNSKSSDPWTAIQNADLFQSGVTALIQVSTYWATYLLQRNLGAAIDLSQLINLGWGSFSRNFLSPTPRELIEISGPQPFDYASYYNYFLFYSTVAMCFATLQPLVLPITAFYFFVDSYLKKYLLLYVFITKTESGGQFWRVVFNRFIFLAFMGNLVIALVTGAQGSSWTQLYCLCPLPFLLLIFKWYCSSHFDNETKYYTTGTKKADIEAAKSIEHKTKKNDRVGVRFGHPVLYKPLITPMVNAKSQHLLKSIYSGRTAEDVLGNGYSDVYMDPMSHDRPGQLAPSGPAPFEFVNESDLDFGNYKNRPEFRDQAGGDGELYGRPTDLIRRTSGSTIATTQDGFGYDRPGSSGSRDSTMTRLGPGNDVGTTYPAGYQKTATYARDQSPASSTRSMDISGAGGPRRGRSDSNASDAPAPLLHGASRMGRSPVLGGPAGYSQVRMGGDTTYTPGETPPGYGDNTSYDYFRRGR